jgi:hypothetical protein
VRNNSNESINNIIAIRFSQNRYNKDKFRFQYRIDNEIMGFSSILRMNINAYKLNNLCRILILLVEDTD